MLIKAHLSQAGRAADLSVLRFIAVLDEMSPWTVGSKLWYHARTLWKDQQQTMCPADWVSKIRPNAKPVHFCRYTVTTALAESFLKQHYVVAWYEPS